MIPFLFIVFINRCFTKELENRLINYHKNHTSSSSKSEETEEKKGEEEEEEKVGLSSHQNVMNLVFSSELPLLDLCHELEQHLQVLLFPFLFILFICL